MDPLAELKALMLRPPARTLAAAESVTCGGVQARIGAISGASQFFLGGLTAYTLEQKVRHLGVDRAHAAAVDCVSARVAAEMARGACAFFGADIALATTGYAEPAPEKHAAAPFAWWALCDARTGAMRGGRTDCPGATRAQAQARIADAALAGLMAYLQETR